MPSHARLFRDNRKPIRFDAWGHIKEEKGTHGKKESDHKAAKKPRWLYYHARMSASGEKSIALLVTATVKLVIEDASRLKEVARKQELKKHTQLVDLPPEIHLLIFENLDCISSTCLGLACKAFYKIHRSIHGSVPLWLGGYRAAWYMSPPISGLWISLKDWFPADLRYNFQSGKYMTEKAFGKFLKERKAMREERQAQRQARKRRAAIKLRRR